MEPGRVENGWGSGAASPVRRRKHDAQRFRGAYAISVENQRLEPLHVRFIDMMAECRDRSLLILRQRLVALARDRVYLGNDVTGVRLNYLSTVGEVNFVNLVVRGVVNRPDDHPRARGQVSDSGR